MVFNITLVGEGDESHVWAMTIENAAVQFAFLIV